LLQQSRFIFVRYCAALDGIVRMGRSLKDKAPHSDHQALHDAIVQLKTKWSSLCSKAVDRYVLISSKTRKMILLLYCIMQ